MRYYEWVDTYHEREVAIRRFPLPTYDFGEDYTWDELLAGRRIKKWKDSYYADFRGPCEIPDAVNVSLGPRMLSPRLKDFLERQRIKNVQFLPITLRERNCGAVIAGYHVLVCVGLVDCIDQHRTRMEEHPDYLDGRMPLGDYVLKRSSIPRGAKLFRIKYHDLAMIVREDLAKAMEAEQFTGLNFRELQLS